jgi:hypothetical protein
MALQEALIRTDGPDRTTVMNLLQPHHAELEASATQVVVAGPSASTTA